jgi:hypothetical protein
MERCTNPSYFRKRTNLRRKPLLSSKLKPLSPTANGDFSYFAEAFVVGKMPLPPERGAPGIQPPPGDQVGPSGYLL